MARCKRQGSCPQGRPDRPTCCQATCCQVGDSDDTTYQLDHRPELAWEVAESFICEQVPTFPISGPNKNPRSWNLETKNIAMSSRAAS